MGLPKGLSRRESRAYLRKCPLDPFMCITRKWEEDHALAQIAASETRSCWIGQMVLRTCCWILRRGQTKAINSQLGPEKLPSTEVLMPGMLNHCIPSSKRGRRA